VRPSTSVRYGFGNSFRDIFWHGFRESPIINCRSSDTETEAGVSLGHESVRLRSRHGDSQF
jgi:hypothetical protein